MANLRFVRTGNPAEGANVALVNVAFRYKRMKGLEPSTFCMATASMFQYACREDTHGLEVNPVLAADKRTEPPPAALDY